MVSIGMIFQFNNDQGAGLIMLSDGQKKEFTLKDWIDETNTPRVGLEIVYDSSDALIKIRVPSEAEKDALKLKKKPKKDAAADLGSTEGSQSDPSDIDSDVVQGTDGSVEEHIKRFQDDGYRLIKDINEKGSRTAMLRRYVMDEHSEIIIKCSDDKTTLTKTVNGKKVT